MSTRSANDAQLTLGLPATRQPAEAALRRAFAEHGPRQMTYERAMATPAIARCLKNIAAGYQRWQRKPIAQAVAEAFNRKENA